ncbi:MAG: hypothetical protein Q8R42_04865 [Desulfocapsaceae bacterium]|jgi:hypothetical protein|nr:hypothetical protein [Desulfocapsaceae bacterium]MDP3695423.1 hypothetical protein [Desulfocapsaceae bacterium]
MAATLRKQKKKIRFELTFSAIAGVGVVFFCIFLWMFLLGVWAGESFLRPSKITKAEMNTTAVLKKSD